MANHPNRSKLRLDGDKFAEDKARDSLAFNPLPDFQWLTVGERAIYISVKYSERLSHLLRSIDGARWDPEKRRWKYPFLSAEKIRQKSLQIDELAQSAKDNAEEETRRRREQAVRAGAERREQQMEVQRKKSLNKPAPLKAEHLYQTNRRPIFALRLESIADNEKGLPFGGFRSRCWVAQIFGADGKGNWVRAFLVGARDYTHANSEGSRGIYVLYHLEDGLIYEISDPVSWKTTDRYFATIESGILRKMTKEEVEQCLAR